MVTKEVPVEAPVEEKKVYAIVTTIDGQTITGVILKDSQFGIVMLRVDVAKTDTQPAYSVMVNGQVIKTIVIIDQTTADKIGKEEKRPPSVYSPELLTREEHELKVADLNQKIKDLEKRQLSYREIPKVSER